MNSEGYVWVNVQDPGCQGILSMITIPCLMYSMTRQIATCEILWVHLPLPLCNPILFCFIRQDSVLLPIFLLGLFQSFLEIYPFNTPEFPWYPHVLWWFCHVLPHLWLEICGSLHFKRFRNLAPAAGPALRVPWHFKRFFVGHRV